MKKLFNQEQEKEICSMYISGNTLDKIAKIKDCNKSTIKRVLYRNNLNCRPWSTSEEGKNKLKELLEKRWKNGKMHSGMLGKVHSKETKQLMSEIKIGNKNPFWNGGRKIDKYIYVLCPDHPSRKNKTSKYVAEHVLVIEKQIGRYLNKNEYIHHRNGIKTDNRVENLEIVTKRIHYGKVICPYCEHEFSIR